MIIQNILVIDLDETLIHSQEICIKDVKYNYSTFDKVLEENGIAFNVRPYLVEFLNFAKENFNLIILSASNKDYIKSIINELSIESYFYLILDKEFCINVDKVFIKDLDIFKQLYPESSNNEILLIDNNIFSFTANIKEGILISSFKDDKKDDELLSLQKYLQELLDINNNSDSNLKMVYYNESIFMFEQILLEIE